jgi:hypothetical protein
VPAELVEDVVPDESDDELVDDEPESGDPDVALDEPAPALWPLVESLDAAVLRLSLR